MVRDWGPFAEKSVTFSAGKNVILGKNYSGKTSLVNAIYYALTGDVLAAKAKQEDFAKAKSKDSIVELDIEVGEEAYRIRRRPTRKQFHLLKVEGGEEVSPGKAPRLTRRLTIRAPLTRRATRFRPAVSGLTGHIGPPDHSPEWSFFDQVPRVGQKMTS